MAALLMAFANVQSFLAVNRPIGHGLLVVEAWVPKESLLDSLQAFRDGHYEYVVLMGGPVEPNDSANPSVDYADAEREIKQLNIATRIVKIAVGPSRNRTFAGAITLRRWLLASHTTERCIDVFTTGAHARKSWILFRYALGDNYRVGIIAGPEHSYDPRFWIASRRGIWIVARNIAGYLYSEAAILLDAHGWKVLTEQ